MVWLGYEERRFGSNKNVEERRGIPKKWLNVIRVLLVCA